MTPLSPELQQQLDFLQGFDSIWLGVLAMGFLYGLTLCSLTCIPLITPTIFASQAGFRRGFDATAIFILARIASYTLWGTLAGLFGEMLLSRVDPAWPSRLSGALILAIALRLWLRGQSACRSACGSPERVSMPSRSPWLQMATLGFSTSLMPCLPLSGVLVYAATTQSAFNGALLTLLFGIGASASPLYYIGGATGWLAGRLREVIPQHSRWLGLLSAAILGAFGIRLMMMKV
ncbi:MAG: sulfite exporter TauE/SafE family protein [Candidatus Thiodiazotropha sp.]|jgi:sulfite exporter TauE/SafE